VKYAKEAPTDIHTAHIALRREPGGMPLYDGKADVN
jgi:hypothetical protein